MPVFYTSILDEHLAVRTAAGVFDISHMGQIEVNGPSAKPFLNRLLTNDVSKLAPGQGQYTLMCNPSGGVIDDLYVYCLANQQYLLIVNASRILTTLPGSTPIFRGHEVGEYFCAERCDCCPGTCCKRLHRPVFPQTSGRRHRRGITGRLAEESCRPICF
jgi:hypothetical protein